MAAHCAIPSLRAGIGLCVVGLAASVASADLTPDVFTLHATVNGQTGSFEVTSDDGVFDRFGNFHWALEDDVNILSDGGEIIATLTNASVTVLADPVINLNFAVQAASSDTTFTITSGLLSFPEIDGAIGAASAGVTVTDIDGNGASISPFGSSMYHAHYNGDWPAGTLFADLLGSAVSAGAFQTGSGDEDYPGGGGFVGVGDDIVSMSAAWTFTLSAMDLASGSSTFVIIPAPAGVAVLGIAGLVAARRRR